MATINLGAIKFNWKGAYNNSTAYVVDDVVSSGGSSYVCILASQGNAVSNGTYWNQMSAAGTNGTNGTDVGTTITTQGDILYRDGSGLQRLAAGTNGQALLTGGAGANPSWGTISSDFVKISTGTLGSGTANWSIDGHFSATYKHYKILLAELTTGNNGATIFGRMNTGGSANNTNSIYSYSMNTHYSTSQTHNGSNGNTEFRLNQNSNSLDFPNVHEYTLFNPLATDRRTSMLYHCHGMDGTGGATNGSIGGVCFKSDTAVTGITIFSDGGGNIQAGAEYLIYGIKG